MDNKELFMSIEKLREHSDARDNRIEKKIDKMDDFLRNGFTDKVLKTLTDYFDKKLAQVVKIIISTAVIAAIGLIVKAIFF